MIDRQSGRQTDTDKQTDTDRDRYGFPCKLAETEGSKQRQLGFP